MNITSRYPSWVQSYPVTTFYLLAFAISWFGWLPALGSSLGFDYFNHFLWNGFLIFPAIGPALAAVFTSRSVDKIVKPVNTVFRWRVSPGWYVFAIAVPVVVMLIANFSSQWLPPTTATAPVRGKAFVLFLTMSVLANPCEEVGWRGFALARLQARYPSILATLIVGIMGRLWHLPIFFLSQGAMAMASLPVWPWVIGTMAKAFVITWLFNRSSSSLVIVSLYHIAMNGFNAFIGINSYWALATTEVTLALGLWVVFGSGFKKAALNNRA